MGCRFEFEMNNLREIYEIGEVARHANGSVLLREKNTVLLAAVTLDRHPVSEDFLPLTVQYIEKAYAAGKFPGGFVKREQKPGDFETLTSRIVDRSLRPLFPKGFNYPVFITIMVLSVDQEADLQLLALHAASAALYVSDLPIKRAVAAARIAKVGQELILNPTHSELKKSTLDLFVAGTKEDLLMIEMRSIPTMESEYLPVATIDPLLSSSEVIFRQNTGAMPEEELVGAIALAKESTALAAAVYEKTFDEASKKALELPLRDEKINEAIWIYIDEFYRDDVYDAINSMAKSERSEALRALVDRILDDETARMEGWSHELVYKVMDAYKKKIVRQMIIKERKRADGRGLSDIRPISIKTNILPSCHGSSLFTRGETQALVVATIGTDSDAQMYELLTDKGSKLEKFMVHYNFPGFSVGEVERVGPPSRRELGHGNLAKRALEPVLDMRFGSTIRLVSEILESNGSSSMATVCGGTLAMMAANIPLMDMVAGVAMGLVIEEGGYAILTDIMGLEDHDGDMDFKVAGTKDGITAMQMDIKLGGIDLEILKEALLQAKSARYKILDLMEEARKKIVPNEAILPTTEVFAIHPSKVAEVIGKAGKTIKEIIERFEVGIEIEKEKGEVRVTGRGKPKVKAACDHIKMIAGRVGPEKSAVSSYKIGEVFRGRVKKVVDFGAFVELPDGYDGLIHISKLAKERTERVSDIVKEGDEVEVTVLSQKEHKVELALNRVLS